MSQREPAAEMAHGKHTENHLGAAFLKKRRSIPLKM